MGKKKKRISSEVVEPFPIEEVCTKFLERYASFSAFVTRDEILPFFQESTQVYRPGIDISWELYAPNYVERKVFLLLRKKIEEGDVDIEIALINKYTSTAKMILHKLEYTKEDISSLAETGIMNAIENYTGEESFQLALVSSLKKLLHRELPKKAQVVIEPIVEERKPKKKKKKKGEVVVSTPKKEFVPILDGKMRPPTTLEQLISTIDILHISPLEDEEYLRFLSLKYGYYENNFYSLEEIAGMLELPYEKVRMYYHQSLEFLKAWFGKELDSYYTYYLERKKDE